MPDAPGAGGAAGAVHVVLGVGREVEVHDAGDVVDVDAACGDVGRDERRRVPVVERPQRAVALTLGAPAVDRSGLHTGARRDLHDPVGTVAGSAEHDRRARRR